MEDLIVRRVDTTGELLDASHDLLMRVFDRSVVDPKEVYVDAVTDRSGIFRDFRAVFLPPSLTTALTNAWLDLFRPT